VAIPGALRWRAVAPFLGHDGDVGGLGGDLAGGGILRGGLLGLVSPTSAHVQAVFLCELAALLSLATLLSALARRFGIPTVVGQLLAGVILGPSIFGLAFGGGYRWLFPAHDPVQSALLSAVSTIGLIGLALVIGFETDIRLIRRLGRPVTTISVGSLVPSLAVLIVAAAFLPAGLRGPHGTRIGVALFMALALSISSLPVVAKIVTGLGAERRNYGQLLIGVGALNDMTGFIALAVLAGLLASTSTSPGHLVKALVVIVAVTTLLVFFGQRFVDLALRRLRRLRRAGEGEVDRVGRYLALALVTALVGAALVQASGVEGAAGAFVAGVVLARSRFDQPSIHSRLESFSAAFFAPIYFATAGLPVELTLLHGSLLIAFAVLLVLAIAVKFAGSYLGAVLGRLSPREGVVLGIGLNGRGALQVIIATAGLTLGIFSTGLYTTVLAISIVSSMVAPVLLRLAAKGVERGPAERQRLEREEAFATSVAVRPGRLLVVVDGEASSLLAGELGNLAWPDDAPVTLLSVAETPGGPASARRQRALELVAVERERLAAVFEPRELEITDVVRDDRAAAVLEEAALGYAVLAIGASRRPSAGRLFRPLVDHLLAASPVPVLVMRAPRGASEIRYERILVPVATGVGSRAAQEVAFGLARSTGAEIVLTHVVTARTSLVDSDSALRRRGRTDRSAARLGNDVLIAAREAGEAAHLRVKTKLLQGPSVAPLLLEQMKATSPSLVVLGTEVTILDGGPFLGHSIETILDHSDVPIAVVALPPGMEGE